MHVANQSKNLLHFLIFNYLIFLSFFFVIYKNSALEITNFFLISSLTRFINLLCPKNVPPRLFKSSWLTTVNINLIKWFFVEKFWIVFKLIIIEFSIMFFCNVKTTLSFLYQSFFVFKFHSSSRWIRNLLLCSGTFLVKLKAWSFFCIITFHHFLDYFQIVVTHRLEHGAGWSGIFNINL